MSSTDIKLTKHFRKEFNRLKQEYGEELARLNGFADEQLNYTDFIDNFVDEDVVADVSIDGNANVGHKDIVSLEREMEKPHSKLLGFNKLFYEIEKKYGLRTAKEFLRNEWIGGGYVHDAFSVSYKSYCFAYDLDELATKGLYFIENFNAIPPKHLTTFTDFCIEFVSFNTNRTAGAVALPSYLIYSFYFWHKDCEEGFYTQSPEYYRDQEFQKFIYRVNQPFLKQGVESAFTNVNIFDRPYLIEMFGGKEFPDGTFIIDYIDEIIEYQKSFMEKVSEIRQENMMTFPVITFSLLRKDHKFVDEDFAKWCSNHNMKWGDSNFFVSEDITSLSSCCRLKNDVRELGYFNSIGGSALKVGSVKVNTINLARIAYESATVEDYLNILAKKVLLCLKTLDCIRTIIRRNAEKGLLPNYMLKIIELKYQYNTIGIIGLFEALQEFGFVEKDELGDTYYTDEGIDFAKRILQKIHEVKNEFGKDKDYKINIEQIPGERAAAILMEKDKFFYPNKIYELPLYGNQWIPLGITTSLKEKIRVSAILDQACSGGSIAHINLDAPLKNEDTAWRLLNYIADEGVTYFAFNLRINACKNNHGFYGDTCPICGEPVETTFQRVVGFLTPEKTYSKERKAEFKLRDWFKVGVND